MFVAFFIMLLYTNNIFDLHIQIWKIVISSLFSAVAIAFIGARRRLAISILFIVPLAVAWGFVNPIDSGLDVITHSKLSALLDEKPELRHKKWLVFGDWFGPNYFSAHGLDVFNSFHVIPDLPVLEKLDPTGQYLPIYNSSSYLIVHAQDAALETSFKT